jgi:hypothetical protein
VQHDGEAALGQLVGGLCASESTTDYVDAH